MEPKYKILIVDEIEEQIEEFKTYFENMGGEFEVFSLSELNDENDLFKLIRDKEIDSVAFDYKLMEHNSVKFSKNGDEYLKLILDHFENFPSFIVTNNANDSRYMSTDPFKIISKELIFFDTEDEDQTKMAKELLDKIKESIDKYKTNLTNLEDELHKLIDEQLAGKELTEKQLRRMVELDAKLENSISKKNTIAKEWKSPGAIEKLSDLLSRSESILSELKKIK